MNIKITLIALFVIMPMFISAQSLNRELKSEDISAALKMIGLEVYKYSFDASNIDYNLILHLEEIANDSILNKKSYNLGKWKPEIKTKELKIISNISSDTSETYWLNIVHPNMEFVQPFNISKAFRKAHYWMQIKQGEIVYEQKTPLLFYGMAWEDEFRGMKILRFCWGEDIGRDMKNETLKKVEHKILVSYELVK